MNVKFKSLIRDIVIFAIGALGSKVLLFLLLPLYTNILTDAEYGIADLVFTIGQLMLPFISLAIFNGLIRFGLMKDVRRENVLLCSTIVFLVGSLGSVAITPLFGFYRAINQWKWYLCIFVIVQFAFTNSLTYLKVKDKNKLYSGLSIVQSALLVGFNVLFLVALRWGIRGYLLSTIMSMGITALLAFLMGNMSNDLKSATYDKLLMKEMIVYSAPFILNDLSWWMIHSSDKIMIEAMISGSMLGIYTAASKIPSLINVFASIFSSAWGLSSIKEYDGQNDSGFYSTVFRYLCTVMFGACIVIIAIVRPFMRVYVGTEFFDAWHYVPLLLVSAAFSSIAAFSSSMLGAMKQSLKIMTTTLAAGVINIIVNYVFINLCGVWGAVIGTVTAYFVVAILRMIQVKRKIPINYNIKRIALLAGIATADALLVGLDLFVLPTCLIALILFLIISYKDIILIFRIVSSLKK